MVIHRKPQKDVFWKALLYTVIVFLLGVFVGYVLEENRVSQIEIEFEELLLDWNDAEVLSFYYQNLDEDFCEEAIQQNLVFGDKIYEAGLRLGEYDLANRLTEDLDIEKKNYALLKTKFFINSKIIKERCDADYEFVLYFYGWLIG